MSKKPFFSVVMPTRNRAKLLPFAIRSALSQTFEDFEIIVSDNFSADETPQVVKNFDDERIKYFRAEKSLSMSESWNFALSHAKGEYISFLCDDDAYTKIFLESMANVIDKENADIVSCRLAPYYAVEAFEYGKNIKENSLVILPFDGKITALNREEAVKLLFSRFKLTESFPNEGSYNYPQLVNSAYHHSLIEKVKKRVSNLFPVVANDYYSAALFFNSVQKYCSVDKPLYLHAVWEGSETGGSQTLFEKNPDERNFNFVPLKKFLSPTNYGANTILRAKADWGEDYYNVPLDFSLHFVALYFELKYMQANKTDVSAEIEEFETVLKQQDKGLQEKVRSAISTYNPAKTSLKLKFKESVFGKLALKIKNKDIKLLSGFSSIAECAAQIDESFLAKYSKN